MPALAPRVWFVAIALPTTAFSLGPHQVAILVRADSAEGLHLANRYRQARGVPFENVVHLDYRGPAQRAGRDEFLNGVYKPTLAVLKSRGLESKIHVWITTPGLPYRVADNSASSVVHFGDVQHPKKDAALGPAGYEQSNRYAGVMLGIDGFNLLPGVPRRPLHMHLWAGDLESTLALIDRSAAADGQHPAGTFYLCDGVGPRAVRKDGIPRAQRMLELLGQRVERPPGGEFRGKRDVLGLLTGVVSFPVSSNGFAPGALADHLTSLGGVLDEPSGQMSCLEFLRGGASASYGAVVEPYNYPTKFPAPMAHAAYATGFTAVESYWMSVTWPQEGVFVGDPLARPFGRPPKILVSAPQPFATVGDKLVVDLAVGSADVAAGVGSVDLWIDGRHVGNLGQRRLPPKSSLVVTVDGKEIAVSVDSAGSMNELAATMKKRLEASGLAVDLGAGSIYLRSPRQTQPPTIAVKSSSPLLHATAVGGRFHSGRPQPTAAVWEMVGKVEANDAFAWEWTDADGTSGKSVWKASRNTELSEAAQRMIDEFGRRSPSGARWSTVAGRTARGEVGAVLRCELDAARPSQGLKARLTMHATNLAGWKQPPRSDWVKFVDPTGLADDFAWIRFGAGPMLASAKNLSLPLDKEADGLHYLRIAATLGGETLAASVGELPFVKRTSDKRLRLRSLASKVRLGDRPVPVAAATFDGGLEPGAMEFRVDERPVIDNNATLTVDPRVYGVGTHRIRARMRGPDGAVLREADDAVEFAVEP